MLVTGSLDFEIADSGAIPKGTTQHNYLPQYTTLGPCFTFQTQEHRERIEPKAFQTQGQSESNMRP